MKFEPDPPAVTSLDSLSIAGNCILAFYRGNTAAPVQGLTMPDGLLKTEESKPWQAWKLYCSTNLLEGVRRSSPDPL